MAMPLDQKKTLRNYSEKFKDKLLKIKVCAFDVDGILTSGHVTYFGKDLEYNRATHVRDGWAFKFLQSHGIKVGVISGGNGLALKKRFEDDLKLDFVFLGDDDKRTAYKKILAMGYKDEEILYMGDEFIDLPLLKKAGFSATVPSASFEIQEAVDYITMSDSGNACAREVIDILRVAKDLKIDIPDF